jgi:phosphoribosylaminoimidazolecarboxamide formyltransferase/IMP cyclohydrolase
MRALLSVSDKTGIGAFARGLTELGFELVSSGGTAAFLAEQSLDVTRVEEVTEAPELLGGRVKTLHPRVHAGILARRDVGEDLDTLARQQIEPFDLVCVNFYPFASVVAQPVSDAEAVEAIDIGGPSLLRAAAKNFAHVAAVSSPDQYESVLAELRGGSLSLETRRALAAEAFVLTAAYEAAIARWFADSDGFAEHLTLTFDKVRELPYGENPHQRAAYYREYGARRHLLSIVEQLGGRELSFNNLVDLEGARRVARQFSRPTAVIVKHANPCGVASAGTIEEAYDLALASDPVSAFGCVLMLTRPVSSELGRRIAERFVEVVHAPGFEEGALEALRAKPSLRILWDRERSPETSGERDYRRVLGGLLVQERDDEPVEREAAKVVTGSLASDGWDDLLFAWKVCAQVSSNAIVIAKREQTIGIGAGQMNRVDAVRIAVAKATEHGHELAGAVLASDAFFPFADGAQHALEAGVRAIIQPGGSKRDGEVIAAVEAAGAAMVFTGRRHFRH